MSAKRIETKGATRSQSRSVPSIVMATLGGLVAKNTAKAGAKPENTIGVALDSLDPAACQFIFCLELIPIVPIDAPTSEPHHPVRVAVDGEDIAVQSVLNGEV